MVEGTARHWGFRTVLSGPWTRRGTQQEHVEDRCLLLTFRRLLAKQPHHQFAMWPLCHIGPLALTYNMHFDAMKGAHK